VLLSSIRDLFFALSLARCDATAFYDALAPRYDRIHRRWLRAGGAESIAVLRGCLVAELRPGVRVLDAGCGTGELARWVIEQEPLARITVLDASRAMLDRASAVPGRQVLGDLLGMPLPNAAFDIVICAWALETVDDPMRAASELERVLAPGGLLCCCYCTEPESCLARWRTLPLRNTVTHVFKGRFLEPGIGRTLGNGRVRWLSSGGGLSTFLCYRKPPGQDASSPA
jgi:ubiquinone/menaquinone biosynthesis C-methylase UbiE